MFIKVYYIPAMFTLGSAGMRHPGGAQQTSAYKKTNKKEEQITQMNRQNETTSINKENRQTGNDK
jgi:hypothetical protein